MFKKLFNHFTRKFLVILRNSAYFAQRLGLIMKSSSPDRLDKYMMSVIKRIPWVSLTLALLTYCCLGWVISQEGLPTVAWFVIIPIIVLVIGALAVPWAQVTSYSNFLFKSDVRTFCLAVLGAFALFLMISWFRLFLDSLLIISATILVRIDFQSAGFRHIDTFAALFFIAMTGLAMGVLINRFVI
jgi:hypothetical protein